MSITNMSELKEKMEKLILKPLLEHLSKKAIEVLRKELDKADISTDTLQNYIVYEIDKNGTESTIFIELDLMQENEGKPPIYISGYCVEWGRFTSLDGNTHYKGSPITWHMVDWLENGVSGDGYYIGNQPIKGIGIFRKTNKILKENIPIWTRQFTRQFNYKK